MSKKQVGSSQQQNMVKTHIIGFCYGCISFHYTPETYTEDGERWCRRTGRIVTTDGFVPPIPVDVPGEEILAIKEDRKLDPEKMPPPPTPQEMIRVGIDELAFYVGVDEQKHREVLDDIAARFCDLLDGSVVVA